MTSRFSKYDKQVSKAVKHYWSTLEKQASKQKLGNADRGNRAKVTGGKQMDGFCDVIEQVVKDAGLKGPEIYRGSRLDLPGYFRPTKRWDIVIIDNKQLVAAVEFKSIASSFGNNLNNRSEEAIGSAKDFRVAFDEGAFGKASAPPPWLGWLMLFTDCEDAHRPLKVNEPFFPVFKEFVGASYSKRCEILIRKLVNQRLYDAGALLLSCEGGSGRGKYSEPASDLRMRTFLASLYGHIGTYLASKEK